jgi:hypothetical protein
MGTIKNLIVALAICCSSGICLAQQAALLTPGSRNLYLDVDAIISPYPALLNFNISLKGQSKDGEVPASRHPIIPLHILRDAYTKAVMNGHLRAFDPFMKVFANHIRNYAADGDVDCSIATTATLIVEVSNLALAQSIGWVHHNIARPIPTGMKELGQYYLWIPGNTYIGPTARGDLPEGNGFDWNAIHIIGSERLLALNKIYINLDEYIAKNDETFLKAAVEEMSKLATITQSEPLIPNNWLIHNGKYQINTDSQRSFSDTQNNLKSNARSDQETCTNLLPTFDEMRIAVIATLSNYF